MTTVLAVLALLVALAALALALMARRSGVPQSTTPDDVPADVEALRGEVASLQNDVRSGLRHLAVVRYDAFTDMGGHLSWSLVLADDTGSGAVVTSIHGRSDTRTYAKAIHHWESDQQLSPEEQLAVKNSRPDS